MSQQLHPAQVMVFLNHLYTMLDTLLEHHDVYKASEQWKRRSARLACSVVCWGSALLCARRAAAGPGMLRRVVPPRTQVETIGDW